MNGITKSLVSKLPNNVRHQAKLVHYALQMRTGRFVADDTEFGRLAEFVKPGDIAIDVGANVGHYTRRLSEVVGPTGRVIAFEPFPETFAMLAGNVCGMTNVSLLNVAASDKFGMVSMDIPPEHPGNLYRAAIVKNGSTSMMAMPIDALELKSCALIKIDAEGHDMMVLEGARQLIQRCRPILIVETFEGDQSANWLRAAGYRLEWTKGVNGWTSPNAVGFPE
jgi:FkbM family methyltransferase